MNFHPNA